MPNRPPDRAARDRAFVVLYRAGWTVPMIAALSGSAPSTVTRAIAAAGVPRRRRWG